MCPPGPRINRPPPPKQQLPVAHRCMQHKSSQRTHAQPHLRPRRRLRDLEVPSPSLTALQVDTSGTCSPRRCPERASDSLEEAAVPRLPKSVPTADASQRLKGATGSRTIPGAWPTQGGLGSRLTRGSHTPRLHDGGSVRRSVQADLSASADRSSSGRSRPWISEVSCGAPSSRMPMASVRAVPSPPSSMQSAERRGVNPPNPPVPLNGFASKPESDLASHIGYTTTGVGSK